MKPRTRSFMTLAGGLATVALAAVLYGIIGRDVHATASPPPVMDKPFKLADFHGRYMLVNLWATWCAPCINELPELARLQKELPQDRITVVPVDVLERLDAEKLGAFLTMHGADGLPVYIDNDRATQRGFIANE